MPTVKDIEKIALALNVPVTELIPGKHTGQQDNQPSLSGVTIIQAVLELFPGLDAYVDMLNNAVRVQDRELIAHISDKVAGLLTTRDTEKAVNE